MSEEKSKSTAVEVGASAERKKAGASTHGEKPPVQQISRDEFINSVAKGWDRGRGSHLLYFSGSDDHKFWPFRLNELDALTEMFVGKDAKVYDMSTQVFPPSPFIRADFPNDESVLKIMDRSMTLKGAYEVIARSSTLDSLVSQLQTMTATDELKKIMHADSFHLNITAYGYSLTASERQTMRDALSFVPFPETVDVKSPAKRFVLLVECIPLNNIPPELMDAFNVTSTSDPRVPIAYYFCRVISDREAWWPKYDLPKRPYIGPTSTDPQLAFLMANIAKVTSKSLVFDPFVGTGSILVSSAVLGAAVHGQDIDWKVVHGKLKGRSHNLFDNFKHYGLPRPDIVCTDSARSPWRVDPPLWDAIVTDPPYGVRAGAKRLGPNKKGKVHVVTGDETEPYVPMTKPYPVLDIMIDLLETAAKTLVKGGRLIYLLPTQRDFVDSELLSHPCLRHVSSSSQELCEFSRRAIAHEKVKDYDAEEARAWVAQVREEAQVRPPRWTQLHELPPREEGMLNCKGLPLIFKSERKERRRLFMEEVEKHGSRPTDRESHDKIMRAVDERYAELRKAQMAAAAAAATKAATEAATAAGKPESKDKAKSTSTSTSTSMTRRREEKQQETTTSSLSTASSSTGSSESNSTMGSSVGVTKDAAAAAAAADGSAEAQSDEEGKSKRCRNDDAHNKGE